MSPCIEHGVERRIIRLDDESVEEFVSTDRAAVIVTGRACMWCQEYLAGVEIAQALGDLRDLAIGVLVVDAPGVEQFTLENPWLADAEGLPYTALYRDGLRVDGFVAFNVFSLIDRLEYLAFLPVPERRAAMAGVRLAA